MKSLGGAIGALILMAGVTSATSAGIAADIAVGKDQAEACAACHGLNGISVSGDIPNLAGQKTGYLVKQLSAFRDATRKNAIMNAIAGALSDAEIADLAAFWNSLPGASGGEVSEMPPEIVKTRVRFPQGYEASFTYYLTINFPGKKQVRKYFANEDASRAIPKNPSRPGTAATACTRRIEARATASGARVICRRGIRRRTRARDRPPRAG